LIVVAAGLWRGFDAARDTTLVAAASELVDGSGRPLASGPSYALRRTRSSAYDALIALPPDPSAIELRVRPEMPAPRYSVAISRISPDGSVTPLGSVNELPVQADDFVQLYVDSSRLEPGPYLLVLTPTRNPTAESTSAFRLKVVPGER